MTEIRQIHLDIVYRASVTCSSFRSLNDFIDGADDEIEKAILELGKGSVLALLQSGTSPTTAETYRVRLAEQPEASMIAECLRRLIAELSL